MRTPFVLPKTEVLKFSKTSLLRRYNPYQVYVLLACSAREKVINTKSVSRGDPPFTLGIYI
jgi:hypothetical protein